MSRNFFGSQMTLLKLNKQVTNMMCTYWMEVDRCMLKVYAGA